MASQAPFEQHRKLLLYIADKVRRRVHAAGAVSIQAEDIFQELCIAWCQARDKWDEKHGVPFGAYLMRGMSNHINRWAQRELREHTIAPFELDYKGSPTFWQEWCHPVFHSDLSLHDFMTDESQVPIDEALITKDLRDFARDPLRSRRGREKLLPQTEKFLDLMENPPPALIAIVSGIQARAAYGRNSLNIPNTYAPKRLTDKLVFDFMGVDTEGRKVVYQQLKRLHRELSQQ